jgi:serine/threonine-protein kinase
MIGKNFMNRYQIVSKLGSGGTAVVYKAIDTVLNREVTVKILQEQFTTNQKFVLRFRKEAQAIAALSHPNIVSVYDVGTSEDGKQYLIMEYVEGSTLKEVIKKKGVLSLDRSLDYTNQILAGLNHAHSFGVIHRDIKPQNIMITPTGQVKIMDFGLAMNLTDTTITYDTSVFGSVYYIAPEIAQKGSGDARVDIYSTGIVLYEMLTGELPYTADSPIAIALQHVEGDYTPIDEIDEEIPYEIARIVDKAMAVNPSNRYSSAKIMMDDIETAADEYDVVLTPIQLTTAAAAAAGAVHRGRTSYDSYDENYEGTHSRRRSSGSAAKSRKKNEKEKSNKKLVVAIIAIAAAIIILSVGAYAIIRNMSASEEVEVPDVVGLTEQEAIADLEALNLQYKITEEETDEYDPGIVMKQSIDAGTKVKEGKVVELTVSIASDEVEVPDVTGMTEAAATSALEDAGFKVDVQEESSDSVDEGNVIRQSPSGGRKLAKDETVIIVVSTGEDDVSVPSLIGLTKEDAIAKITSAGLQYSITSYEYSDDYESGYVIYQNYSSGEAVPPDTVINIKISKGPDPANEPVVEEPDPGDNPADEEEIE